MAEKTDGLNRVISTIKRELNNYPTYKLECLLKYAEELENEKSVKHNRTFQAGNSKDWKQFVKEFDFTSGEVVFIDFDFQSK
jgi:hypothetical protein